MKKIMFLFFPLSFLFWVINDSSFLYFKTVKFKTEELEINYHYKWGLITGIPIKRKVSIFNHRTNIKNSQKLIDDPENFSGFNDVRFYRINNKTVENKGRLDILLIQDGWTTTIINWNTLELLEQEHAQIEETMNIQFTEIEKKCLGLIQQDFFLIGDCEVRFK